MGYLREGAEVMEMEEAEVVAVVEGEPFMFTKGHTSFSIISTLKITTPKGVEVDHPLKILSEEEAAAGVLEEEMEGAEGMPWVN